MLQSSNFKAHAEKFEAAADAAERLALANEVRDSIEIVHTAEYSNFLKVLFPALAQVLKTTPPHFTDSPEHKLRNVVLEILNRLPHSEVLKPFVHELLHLTMSVLEVDNEDNALICLRVLLDLHKNFRPQLEQEVKPFLEFVSKLYGSVKEILAFFFGKDGLQAPPITGPSGSPLAPPTAFADSVLVPSTRSFKVMTECPLIVMFLFQLYQGYVQPNVPVLLPLMVETIAIRGPDAADVPANLTTVYSDMKGAQVKTVSFLTYLLRGFSESIRPHQEVISQAVVHLLMTCPDHVATRKELLIATRHVLATNFRLGFFSQIDKLLEEKVLVGAGRACHELLRPLAYSLLAELIHHVRMELQLPQLSKVIYIFSRNVHDSSLPLNVQATCLRLMLNLVEGIFSCRTHPQQHAEGRALLGRILDAFVSKFGTLRRQVPKILNRTKDAAAAATAELTERAEGKQSIETSSTLPLESVGSTSVLEKQGQLRNLRGAALVRGAQEQLKELNDCKQLLKTLTMGMKTIVWSITNYEGVAQQSLPGLTPRRKGLSDEEVRSCASLLSSGVQCLRLFTDGEATEIFEHFAAVFTVLEAHNFLDILRLQLPALFHGMLGSSALVQVPHHLLQSTSVGRFFADALVTFLVEDKVPCLAKPQSAEAQLVLKLFSLLLHAVCKFKECENVLRPHIIPLVDACLKGIHTAPDPSSYVRLLRYLFRALAQAKFDALYREFVPALSSCLNVLTEMLAGPDLHGLQDIVVELCLTLPARLSSLLPSLPLLIKPLICALMSTSASSSELQLLGLRTLEFWVDSLNPEFLEPCIAENETELILALWALLKPQPAPFGTKALQLLGKLGGRSRRFLREPMSLDCKLNPEHGLRLILTFEPNTSFLIPLDRCIQLARSVLPLDTMLQTSGSETQEHRTQALAFLRVCLSSLLNLSASVPKGEGTNEQTVAEGLRASLLSNTRTDSPSAVTSSSAEIGVKTKTQLFAERAVFTQLLQTLIISQADPALRKENAGFVQAVCRHFAFLFVSRMNSETKVSVEDSKEAPTVPTAEEKPEAVKSATSVSSLKELDPELFLDALTESLCVEGHRVHTKAALEALKTFLESILIFAEARHCFSKDDVPHLSLDADKSAKPEVTATKPAEGEDAAGNIEMKDAEPAPEDAGGGVTEKVEEHKPIDSAAAAGGSEGTAGDAPVEKGDSQNVKLPEKLSPALDALIPRLLHCCYKDGRQATVGGVLGVSMLTKLMPASFSRRHLPRMARAVLHALRLLPEHAVAESDEAAKVFMTMLQTLIVDGASVEEESVKGTLSVLAEELFSLTAGSAVRQKVEEALELMAARTGKPIAELLEPLHEPLVQPLLNRSLQSKHVVLQVETVAALKFCMRLRPALLKVSEPLMKVLAEALSITEAEEVSAKFYNTKTAQAIAQLRTGCIELLCASITFDDLKEAQEPKHKDIRQRTIAMFFKALTSRTPGTVHVAKEGLRQVIEQEKPPKELLQLSLRPILVNLAHYNKLTLPLLQGLARLLELLSNWFNVTLGEKLIEHLKKWLEPEKLAAGPKNWKNGEEVKVAAAIIELFHLLPPAAVKFLEPLVSLTIQLEGALPPTGIHSEICSPYRPPLTKFLNHYPAESIDFFVARISQSSYFHRFLDMLRSEEGKPLREELMKSSTKLLTVVFLRGQTGTATGTDTAAMQSNATESGPDAPGPQGSAQTGSASEAAQLAGVKLLSVLCKLQPEWLATQPDVFQMLQARWRDPLRETQLATEERLALAQVKESKRLVKCMLSYVRHKKDETGKRSEVEPLYDMLSVFGSPTRVDFTFLKDFYANELANGYSPEEKHSVLTFFLDRFQNYATSSDSKAQAHVVFALQLLVLPMLSQTLEKGGPAVSIVLTPEIVKNIVTKVLDPPDEVSKSYDEPLRIELLQLATLLIRCIPHELVSHRKELIKFGWNHLKREDASSKQWAFVNVCHFLDAYQAPEKIVLQVFVALLRTCQPEARQLVRQALDILTPALPRRLQQGEHKYPIWIRYTKKILYEEGHSLPHLIHILQLLVRHAPRFYSSRAQFVPQMVNSLSRLGLPTNSPPENRWLAIDLAGLVVHWEKQRKAGNAPALPKVTPAGKEPLTDEKASTPEPESGEQGLGDKREREDDTVAAEDISPTKKAKEECSDMKAEPGSASAILPPGASPLPVAPKLTPGGATGTPSTTQEEDFKPNAAMEEMIVNFLIRMAFLTGDSKDKELMAPYHRTVELLSEALTLWPNVNIKLQYMEKLLGQPSAPGVEVPPALMTALDVLNRVLTVQPEQFINTNTPQVLQVFERCVGVKSQRAHTHLCSALSAVVKVAPTPVQPPALLAGPAASAAASMAGQRSGSPQALSLHSKIEEVCKRTLSAAHTQPAGPALVSTPSSGGQAPYSALSCCLRVFKVLSAASPTHIDAHVQKLVQVFSKLAREHALAVAGLIQAQIQQGRSATKPTLSEEYGSITYILVHILDLLAPRVLHSAQEPKTQFLRTLLQLLNDRATSTTVLLAIQKTICEWAVQSIKPNVGGGALNPKDAVHFMNRLAILSRTHADLAVSAEWEKRLLNTIYQLCTEGGNQQPQMALRQETFSKVERTHMLGLRTTDRTMRKKFFELHHSTIGKTLYQRLQYIVQGQDWDALSDTFWLKQGLDLVLSILVTSEPINLAPNSAQIPPARLHPRSNLSEEQAKKMDAIGSEPPDGPWGRFNALVSDHATFLVQSSKLRVSELMEPLQAITQRDSNVAYHLWVLTFPIVWATLQKDDQVSLAKPMIALLSKEHHRRQASARPNVVQALLEGISLSQPQPKIPSELIKFLGKTYNAWHIAIPVLESHVMLFAQDARCFDALAELYRLLNEEDALHGLWRQRCSNEATRVGLSLVQHGHHQEAQDVFFRAVQRLNAGGLQNQEPHKAEKCLWESKWIASARCLGQWEMLGEFAKSVEHLDLQMDTAWRLADWAGLKEVLSRAQVEDSPRHHIMKAYYALHEGLVQVAEQSWGRGMQSALEHWWKLPELGSAPHQPALQVFQQLVELQESTRVLVELLTAQRNRQQGRQANTTFSELKDTLETWRLRLPNVWDPFPWWQDLLQWRMHMYNIVTSHMRQYPDASPQRQHMGTRDKAWCITKLAAVARKQGLAEVAVSILNKHYSGAQLVSLEIQEAFVRLHEQSKAYLTMEGEVVTALNLLDSTNLDYFPGHHKAELFRLNGELLRKAGDTDGATTAFSTAVSLCKQLPEAWISWGEHCDALGEPSTQIADSVLWHEYAASCYLQGVRHGAAMWRPFLARVLELLSFYNTNAAVGQAFMKGWESLPLWVWLTWVPQLFISLQREEATHVKPLLIRLALVYPQGVYYPLRTFLLEHREAALYHSKAAAAEAQQRANQTAPDAQTAATGSSAARKGSDNKSEAVTPTKFATDVKSTAQQAAAQSASAGASRGNLSENIPSSVSVFESAKDVMERLRQKHGNLAGELEVMLTEIGARFMPLPEERLLAVVHALLHRCYKYQCATTAEVPRSLKNELNGVCKACFNVDTVIKHATFVSTYKEDVERDLEPSRPTFAKSLSELITRLKTWKATLQSDVHDRLPATLRLEDESAALRDLRPLEIEVPGQYLMDREVVPDNLARLQRIKPDIQIVRRHGTSHRRISFIGSTGKTKLFLVQTSLTPAARGEERMVQLLRALNVLLDKHHETRRRGLTFHTPAVIPVWPQVRLMEDEPTYSSYGEAYEINSARYGRESDLPVLHFKEQLNPAILGEVSTAEEVTELRLKAYKEITSLDHPPKPYQVSENVFTQFMYKTLPTCNHLWTFKKQFCAQLALSGFISWLLRIGGRAPYKILFAKSTGKIFMLDFHPSFNSNGSLDSGEFVPFRLTRNLHTFFTPFGVEGVFVAAMCAAAQAVMEPRSCLSPQLSLFFRDELTILPTWRRIGTPQGVIAGPKPSAAELKQISLLNVEEVLKRARTICPAGGRAAAAAAEQGVTVQRNVRHLVEQALSPRLLCKMDATWQPFY